MEEESFKQTTNVVIEAAVINKSLSTFQDQVQEAMDKGKDQAIEKVAEIVLVFFLRLEERLDTKVNALDSRMQELLQRPSPNEKEEKEDEH